MNIFGDYARYYDLLYSNKNYAGETDYIHGLIQSHHRSAKKILNLGCGSGSHDRHFVAKGYSVTGVDLSEEMLAVARKAAADISALEYVNGDIRSIRLDNSYDVVTSLFHVMSYQVTTNDLMASFVTARDHLNSGGIFIFDCWYGPGVLTDRPTIRIRDLEDETIRVTRIAQPVLCANENVVDVNYRVFIRNIHSENVKEICETHRMRYLFLPELNYILELAGFDLLVAYSAFSLKQLSENDWNAVLVARSL